MSRFGDRLAHSLLAAGSPTGDPSLTDTLTAWLTPGPRVPHSAPGSCFYEWCEARVDGDVC
jgi:hypothetical protein